MKRLPFKKIDAFTTGRAEGNPAGCVYLDEGTQLTDAEMTRIARELKGFVSEVGFLRSDRDGLSLRYFSSECEVDFCGHATIAVMYDLILGNRELRRQKELLVRVGTESLSVLNRISEENAVFITAPSPRFLPCGVEAADVAESLSAGGDAVDPTGPIQVINAGLRTLIVPLVSLDTCLSMHPRQDELRKYCLENDIDIVLVFCRQAALPKSDYRTRVFAPRFGYLEDPATGSGNAAFGHYLLQQGWWNGGGVVIEQGPSRDNPNIVRLRSMGDGPGKRVLFGGAAVLRIDGSYCLQE